MFHSKLILYEFDDRLRVIIPSANLYVLDWEMLSQVIWFQDFFPKKPVGDSEFKDYLEKYMERVVPRNIGKNRQVYRQKIDLDKYDFSTANAKLVASMNGRFNGPDLNRYG